MLPIQFFLFQWNLNETIFISSGAKPIPMK